MVVFLKKKYNYDQEKIEVPTEEEILQFCQFKSFEKDLKQVAAENNAKQSDPSKKVIEEKLPEDNGDDD